MGFSILFGDKNLILNMEVRNVILKVYIFGYDERTDNLIVYFCDKTEVSGTWIDCTVVEGIIHLFGLVKYRNEIISLLKIVS